MLDRILETKRREVEVLKRKVSYGEWERRIADLPPCRGFARALSPACRNRAVALIAEVKRASPSKGVIRADFDPVAIARAYERSGADCLSVLTDETFFRGSLDHLRGVREAVRIPVLRKDFTIDPVQVFEARTAGADAVLLIACALADREMAELYRLARDVGLDVLVEVHDRAELERALELGASLIGINNRNLRTFETDLAVTESLMRYVPPGVVVVGESGISGPEDVARLAAAGVDAVLVGEHLMRQPDVEEAVVRLMGLVARSAQEVEAAESAKGGDGR